jgi:hypothetical protein
LLDIRNLDYVLIFLYSNVSGIKGSKIGILIVYTYEEAFGSYYFLNLMTFLFLGPSFLKDDCWNISQIEKFEFKPNHQWRGWFDFYLWLLCQQSKNYHWVQFLLLKSTVNVPIMDIGICIRHLNIGIIWLPEELVSSFWIV